MAVDVYAGIPHVQVYETRWEADDAAYDTWLDEVRETVGGVFGLSPQAPAIKVRRRQKGADQYEKTGLEGEELIVREDGLKFSVNLYAYLDTGLFLDHRQTRAMVRQRSQGKRFLNLFAYTGSFSVHAAAGGASESLTLDLSRTYQEWSLRNFQLNGLDQDRHRLERVDVMQWLEEAPRLGRRYDLIVMDPPSFSNSKKMTATLDVQRDHAWMINRCLGLLSARGELFFSNNRRGFKLYEDELAPCRVEEITRQTVPEDFGRGRPHRCWIIRRLEG
ncbi:class I SAM-dependent methyltransferase [Ectothiorhodospira lacustris]|uniref:class I SAM-dependent methyltransferase n=1 Tax=Ectothiorhodospira lacustris TaxID=2899127 RepID=UPI001EE94AC9|nr:class I SAM-dependent methyltransferase [Ectothiorhodospira lacustris]MCG5508773.1 class I SAM-dependent methyltransferase [Ectothiorhodospira lacustris]